LGEQLESIFEKLSSGEARGEKGKDYLEIGVDSLPKLPKDLTDRNRTSPFAFTGNKFEFRMVGSSDSIAGPNVMLNTAVAEVLEAYADKLEKSEDVNEAIKNIIISSYTAHKKVIFNGNGYSEDWVVEAEKKGLPNLKSTIDVLPYGIADSTLKLFEGQGVLTKDELYARYYIYAEKYSQQVNIEAYVMIQMANTQIFPAASEYAKKLAESIKSVESVMPDVSTLPQKKVLKAVVEALNGLRLKTKELEKVLEVAQEIEDFYEQAKSYKENVLETMNELRVYGDILERLVEKKLWPFTTYEELLFKL